MLHRHRPPRLRLELTGDIEELLGRQRGQVDIQHRVQGSAEPVDHLGRGVGYRCHDLHNRDRVRQPRPLTDGDSAYAISRNPIVTFGGTLAPREG